MNNFIDFIISFLQEKERQHWRRILLLIVAITVHNIPEGWTIFYGVPTQ
jgi:zinc transporter ZupT